MKNHVAGEINGFRAACVEHDAFNAIRSVHDGGPGVTGLWGDVDSVGSAAANEDVPIVVDTADGSALASSELKRIVSHNAVSVTDEDFRRVL
ncbi:MULTISPECIES: hypothetical protein [unclassified Sinorhizobium]|uniref:hypothetical protein n=1 Tax=unclassified Sinorhizobium TaxID=2613772 RepID=UPI0024C2BE6C|nr:MULTISPECIES: hypothetical protein [unclassified Sinorhizobium]MDK1376184.1 hypothetical protein [Sinorhizobium sp. 6-70]MDK1483033.1 hypothetical protein [Sinorhizobium sp. 6-117]